MSYALILWTNSREVSIVPERDLKMSTKNGTLAKWGKKMYSVKVIMKNKSRKELENSEVLTDGRIISPGKNPSESHLQKFKKSVQRLRKSGALHSRRSFEEAKATEALENVVLSSDSKSEEEVPSESRIKKSLKNVQRLRNSGVLHQRSISDSEEKREQVEGVDNPEGGNMVSLKGSSNEKDHVNDNIEAEKIRKRDEENGNKQKDEVQGEKDMESQRSLDVPTTIGREDIDTIVAAAAIVLKHAGTGKHLKSINKSLRKKEIELVEGSDVFVDTLDLEFITRKYRKNSGEMERRLMKAIIGPDKLKGMTRTGRNGYDPIPINIYRAIQKYVNDHAKFKIDDKYYEDCITKMCNTLRRPMNKGNKPDKEQTKMSRYRAEISKMEKKIAILKSKIDREETEMSTEAEESESEEDYSEEPAEKKMKNSQHT